MEEKKMTKGKLIAISASILVIVCVVVASILYNNYNEIYL